MPYRTPEWNATLSPQELIFCRAYMDNGFRNISQACRVAKICLPSAMALLKTKKFKDYLRRWLKTQQTVAGIMTREEVFGEINKMASRDLADCVVTITKESAKGKVMTITRTDRTLVSAKVRCLELMARVYGMLLEEKPPEHKVEITYNFVSPKQLKAAAEPTDETDIEVEGELVN